MESYKLWKLIRSKISHEDAWIQQRVAWLMAANGFLIAAFSAASNAQIQRASRLVYIRSLLLSSIPCIGFLLSLIVFIGLIGAAKALTNADDEFKKLVSEEKDRDKLPDLHSKGIALTLGRVSSWGVTIIFIIAWLVLLVVVLGPRFFLWCPY